VRCCNCYLPPELDEFRSVALEASGLDGSKDAHRPQLLSDIGSSYIAIALADWLQQKGMNHVRGASRFLQTQGKIERWRLTLNNRILLENYELPGDVEQKIGNFVAYCNHLPYRESIGNFTLADVYSGRSQSFFLKRERIKRDTIKTRGRLGAGFSPGDRFLKGQCELSDPIEGRSVLSGQPQQSRSLILGQRSSACLAFI